MGKLDVSLLRYLSKEDIKVLWAVEMHMQKYELVPGPQVAYAANLKHGGVHKLLQDLCQKKLLCYERGKRYDGYRLTNMGYDYIALRELTKRNLINSFGNQIGVGKESNIYIVADEDGADLCLKLHRLGRTCFRNIKNKRDYLKKGRTANWLTLSKISAEKEFKYMTALYKRDFPVPKPVGFNRHCVVMELVEGFPLTHVRELVHNNVETLYDELMNLIVQLAESGVIHGDFNEFNIMLKYDDEKPVIIDFPQMVSTAHINAEMLFERDVNCIRLFFRKRFGYESELFPKFSDIIRRDTLDAEIYCSGYTKEMEQVLNDEIKIDGDVDCENSEEQEESEDSEEQIECENSDIKEEGALEEDAEEKEQIDRSSYSHIEEKLSRDLGRIELQSRDEKESEVSKGTNKTMEETHKNMEGSCKTQQERIEKYVKLRTESFSSCDSDERFESRSIRSTATSIPLEEIQRRVKNEFKRREKNAQRKRAVAKGEANATTRHRRENRDTIKQSGDGFWG